MSQPHADPHRRSSVGQGARRCSVFLACVGAAISLVVAPLAASAAAPDPTFRSKLFIGVSLDDTSNVAIGDVNGDGRADVVAANYNPSSVFVNLNRGHGNFASHEYAVAWLARSAAIADLNGDRKPDLVVTTDDPLDDVTVVSVLLNKGGGAFKRGKDYDLGADSDFGATGDVNGDGRADLVTANAKTSTVSLLLNRGDGSFEASPERYETGGGLDAVAVGDLNEDGKADVVTANTADNTVSVLRNRGDGSFEPRQDYRTGKFPSALAIRDVNADGKPDLVATNFKGNTVSVLLNKGDGGFGTRRDFRTGGRPSALAIGDVNGDRKPDVAVQNYVDDSVSLLLNKGNGSFKAKLDYDYQFEGESVAIADLNGDRRADIVVPVRNSRNGDSWLAVLVNTPGVCNVQRLGGMTIPEAKQTLARVNCRLGNTARAYSSVKAGLVVSQRPKFGAVLRRGARVNLVVSKGRRK